MQRNLGKLSLLKGLESAWFPIPTILLFYQTQGLNLEDALLLKTALSLAIFLGEVPSGYFADRFGRKLSLLWGGIIWLVAWGIYSTQGSLNWFLMAEILCGVGASLISGADTAIAYDSFKAMGKTAFYRQFEGRLMAIAGVTEAVCGLIGAGIATFNLRFPFYLQSVCIALYIVLALTLEEPKPQPETLSHQALPSLKAIIQLTFWQRREIKWLIGVSATISTGTFLMVWLSQEYLKEQGFAIASFGVVWALLHGVMSVASLQVGRLDERFGRKRLLLGLIITLSGAYCLLALIHHPGGIVFIALVYAVRGIKTPLLLNLLNQEISSDIRATVLSLNSFAFRVGVVTMAPLFGYLKGLYSFDVSLMVTGILIFGLGALGWQKLQFLNVIQD